GPGLRGARGDVVRRGRDALDAVGDEVRRSAVGFGEVPLQVPRYDDDALRVLDQRSLGLAKDDRAEALPLGALPVEALDGRDHRYAAEKREPREDAGSERVQVNDVVELAHQRVAKTRGNVRQRV